MKRFPICQLRITTYVLLAFCVLLTACQPSKTILATPTVHVSSSALTEIPMQIGYGFKGAWFELYFTDPTNPAAEQISGGVDNAVVASLDSARVEIDMAAYSLNLRDVASSLMRAKHRGVKVRLVMESDSMSSKEVKNLQTANIPIVGDELPGLMHNKFIVIDRAEVWVGSMNFTQTGTYNDNNNFMHIHSKELAEDYEAEFNQMFVDHHFGPHLVSQTPHPSVTVSGTRLDIYYSPADHVQSALLPLINHAQSSVYFLAFSFTADAIGNAIRQRAAAGVKVAGVMEADQVKSAIGTEYEAFRKAGLDVHLDGNPGAMHHKVFIIDRRIVVMGSYNFSTSAEKDNDENLVVINNAEIAAQYMKEFQRVYAVAQP
jgi:phosphatidylserine/phosphatidylglycerophosphate/cardiolipin synthase-like enzyme